MTYMRLMHYTTRTLAQQLFCWAVVCCSICSSTTANGRHRRSAAQSIVLARRDVRNSFSAVRDDLHTIRHEPVSNGIENIDGSKLLVRRTRESKSQRSQFPAEEPPSQRRMGFNLKETFQKSLDKVRSFTNKAKFRKPTGKVSEDEGSDYSDSPGKVTDLSRPSRNSEREADTVGYLGSISFINRGRQTNRSPTLQKGLTLDPQSSSKSLRTSQFIAGKGSSTNTVSTDKDQGSTGANSILSLLGHDKNKSRLPPSGKNKRLQPQGQPSDKLLTEFTHQRMETKSGNSPQKPSNSPQKPGSSPQKPDLRRTQTFKTSQLRINTQVRQPDPLEIIRTPRFGDSIRKSMSIQGTSKQQSPYKADPTRLEPKAKEFRDEDRRHRFNPFDKPGYEDQRERLTQSMFILKQVHGSEEFEEAEKKHRTGTEFKKVNIFH